MRCGAKSGSWRKWAKNQRRKRKRGNEAEKKSEIETRTRTELAAIKEHTAHHLAIATRSDIIASTQVALLLSMLMVMA